MKSQSTDDYSPYVDKQSNGYINDINNGVYTNNSLTLVNFDLGQIYNSQKFTDTNDLFCVLPITMVAAFSTGTTLVAPIIGGSNLCSIKTNFVNLIHQADLQVNGKTIESTQPFINVARHFQLLSEMSINDLATIGHSYGFSPTLDNTKSMKYNKSYTAVAGNASSGNGLSNNRPFAGVADNQTTMGAGVQNVGIGNEAGQYKIGKYYDTKSNSNGIVGTDGILQVANLVSEFRPHFEQKGDYLVWYDFAVIKLSHLFESLGKMGLVRRFDATLRLWVNTGTVNVTTDNVGKDVSQNYTLTPNNNSFSNTCPLMVNWLPGDGTTSTYGIPTGTKNIVAGLYIAKPPSTSYAGINLSLSGVAHPLQNCRLYYSQIMLDPQKSITYTNMNLNKKVIYRTFVSNQYNNIGKNSSFNQLINSGIVHPTGVLIVPFIGSEASVGFGDSQWKSPFDTCPATTSPCSLTNLQVSVGGSNVLQSTLFYSYENFLEQVNLAEQLTSSDFGVATGLISQGYWESSRWYFVNVERSQAADKLQPRNVNISFNNNSNCPIDCLIFIFYSDEFVINVETGIINK
jgi:hypothetical protein